jgi:hypothetical protein
MVGLSLVVNSLVLAEWQCFLLTCYCFAIVILLDAITASLFRRVIVCVQSPISCQKSDALFAWIEKYILVSDCPCLEQSIFKR